MSDKKWRPCDDPDELAAAKAAGVAVEVFGIYWQGSAMCTADQFLKVIRRGHRYRVPASWVYEPESEWRETTDPDELAAAVAAGVRPQLYDGARGWGTTDLDADDFRYWITLGARYRVPASWIYTTRRSPVDRVWQAPRADAVQLLRDLQDAACSVMARPDVLGMLHGQTRHALSDLIVDLALALDSLVVMS